MMVVAIVPMRAGSERVPRKNMRPCAGKPLFHWVLGALLECPRVASVVIDTDSPEIIDDAASHFPTVRALARPTHLRAGHVSMNDVLINTLDQLDGEVFLQTHCTSPLLTAETMGRAVDSFEASASAHDSLFSVTPLRSRLWDEGGRPINHDPDVLERTQDLSPIYEENSAIYIFPRTTLMSRRSRIGGSPLLFEMDPVEAWDVDDESDFRVAEALLLARAAEQR